MEFGKAAGLVQLEAQKQRRLAEVHRLSGDEALAAHREQLADALEVVLKAAGGLGRERPTWQLVLDGPLPGLNEYIEAERSHRQKGAAMKRQVQRVVELCAKRQLRGVRFKTPVVMRYTWHERNQRRDKDNVSSFGRKVIQDGLVKAGVLANDGWAQIEGFSDRFRVDVKRPRVEVEIEEVGR